MLEAEPQAVGSSWLAAILDSSQDAIMAWSLGWELTGWNHGAARILGYQREEALGMSVKALWTSEVSQTLEYMVAGLCRDEEVGRFDTLYLRSDGTPVEVAVTIAAIRDTTRRVTGVASIVRDISERKRSERVLAEERTRWVAAFHGAPTGMALIGLDGGWVDVNRAFCRLLQRDRDAVMQTELLALADADEIRGDANEWARVMAGELEGYQTEIRCRLPDGEFIWAQISVALIRGLLDEPLYFVVQLQDITAYKQAESELGQYAAHLAELARVDPVTGLANYRDFHTLLDHELHRGQRSGQPWSIVLLDIDGFRRLNEIDRLRGDRALVLTAEAILKACRASDRAARIGADEFALILPDCDSEQAQTAAVRIAAGVAKDGVASLTHATVTWPQDGDSIELLLLRADMDLQQAKSQRTQTAAAVQDAPGLDACPTDAIREIVTVAKRLLNTDVAYLARIDDDTQVFQTLAGDSNSFGIAEGNVLDLASTYCQRMLEHRIPNSVPAVTDHAELAALPFTAQAQIGAYLGVPVRLTNGHIYGTLCAINHVPAPHLADTDLGVMHSFAGLIANHIEHDVLDASTQRQTAELTGISALLSALTARDHYTGEHSETVVQLASAVSRRLGLNAEQVREVEQVALLHDIGKVGIPDSILQKRGPLTDHEWEVMHQHPTIGARILAGIPMFAHLATAVNAEHERFDGTGYPDGLQGRAIPLASRITFACDAYHAITSDRPYRQALTSETALSELRHGAATQFDPNVVDALTDVLNGDTDPHGNPKIPDVLTAITPRQTPTWQPIVDSRPRPALGHARAECIRCETQTPILVGRATVGGTCTNCGSHELRPIAQESTTAQSPASPKGSPRSPKSDQLQADSDRNPIDQQTAEPSKEQVLDHRIPE